MVGHHQHSVTHSFPACAKVPPPAYGLLSHDQHQAWQVEMAWRPRHGLKQLQRWSEGGVPPWGGTAGGNAGVIHSKAGAAAEVAIAQRALPLTVKCPQG